MAFDGQFLCHLLSSETGDVSINPDTAPHRWINESVITEFKHIYIRTPNINANVAVNEDNKFKIKEPCFFMFKFMNIIE